ncbi:Abi-alpha family protein [Mycolicibacterium fluoranthenivorans]|uniref:DUF4393 domain-containing protein n=1 Tax=Mycolicibacterium fluoranthenivorans TaxID=258505 RepID=A0A7X5TWC3_9MYCO|nr:Abi-alpha family protein [Mycolicibacterium fluoranthenivorans]MCV7355242.1 DUF4393 domain-containing protein [Mycolicibacterium fluoranthenivorans]NIH93936.1 hypothetical protein [Mycolicibacterium fluoranthenivorans]
MAQDISKHVPDVDPDVGADITVDQPQNRDGHERRAFKLATPVGDLAVIIRTPRRRPLVPKRFDPFGIADRALDAAKVGFKLATWGEEQLATMVKNRLEQLDSAPRTAPSADPDAPESLNTKMGKLLDRALDQSTAGSQVELFHRLLDQLVADEARIVGALSDGSASPLVHVYSRSRNTGQPVLENACLIGRTANVALPNMVPQYVGHLLSLGLVEIGPEDPAKKADYEILMAEPMVLRAIKGASRGPLTARVEKQTLGLSGLGRGLWEAAMQQDGP